MLLINMSKKLVYSERIGKPQHPAPPTRAYRHPCSVQIPVNDLRVGTYHDVRLIRAVAVIVNKP
jgi:hypothetical protein